MNVRLAAAVRRYLHCQTERYRHGAGEKRLNPVIVRKNRIPWIGFVKPASTDSHLIKRKKVIKDWMANIWAVYAAHRAFTPSRTVRLHRLKPLLKTDRTLAWDSVHHSGYLVCRQDSTPVMHITEIFSRPIICRKIYNPAYFIPARQDHHFLWYYSFLSLDQRQLQPLRIPTDW